MRHPPTRSAPDAQTSSRDLAPPHHSYVAGVIAYDDIPSSHLAQRSECCTDVFREQLRLFPGREVPAPVVLVVGDEVGVGLLGPAPRDPVDLVDKGADADRDLDALDRDGGKLALP